MGWIRLVTRRGNARRGDGIPGGRAGARDAPTCPDVLLPLGATYGDGDARPAPLDDHLRRLLVDRLERALRVMLGRGVPLRAIEAPQIEGAARLRFADGTSLLAEPVAPGHYGTLSVVLALGGTLRLQSVTPHDDGVEVTFDRGRNKPGRAYIVGFDQPD